MRFGWRERRRRWEKVSEGEFRRPRRSFSGIKWKCARDRYGGFLILTYSKENKITQGFMESKVLKAIRYKLWLSWTVF